MAKTLLFARRYDILDTFYPQCISLGSKVVVVVLKATDDLFKKRTPHPEAAAELLVGVYRGRAVVPKIVPHEANVTFVAAAVDIWRAAGLRPTSRCLAFMLELVYCL